MSRRALLILCSFCLVGSGGWWWWYATSRPAYRLRHAQQALRAGDSEAGEVAAAALEADGCKDEALLLRGEALLLRGEVHGETADLAAALGHFNRVSADGDGRLEAASMSARCLLGMGNLIEAERIFTFVLSRRPDDVDSHRGLMAVYYDLGALPQASEHAQKWADLAPSDGRAHRFLGLAHKDLGEHAEAVPHYRAALQRVLADRVRQEVRMELAECLIRLGEYGSAQLALEPVDPPVHLHGKYLTLRAECQRGLGEPGRARELVDQALGADPGYSPAWRLRGQLALDADEPAHAAGDLEQAASLAPKEFEIHHLLAQAYARQGQTQKAVDAQNRVNEIQGDWAELTKLTKLAMERPKDATLHLRMADLLIKVDMPEMAAAQRRTAASLSPVVPFAPAKSRAP